MMYVMNITALKQNNKREKKLKDIVKVRTWDIESSFFQSHSCNPSEVEDGTAVSPGI